MSARSAEATPGWFQEDHPTVKVEASTLLLHRCDGAAPFVRLLNLEDGSPVIQHEDPPRWERYADADALTARLAGLFGLARTEQR